MSWNEEKISKLKELWGKGSTASQIAEIIGGISRNAVIGKAHRLNLSSKIKTRKSASNQNFQDNEGENKDAECLYVGKGVLSKIVVFGSKLFANIAGESTQDKKDLVTLDSIAGDTSGLRSSWREGNF